MVPWSELQKDVDDGAVRVEYESENNMFEDPVTECNMKNHYLMKEIQDQQQSLRQQKTKGRSVGPDDFEIDVDEVGGTSISDGDIILMFQN